jgi:hypothetical protein
MATIAGIESFGIEHRDAEARRDTEGRGRILLAQQVDVAVVRARPSALGAVVHLSKDDPADQINRPPLGCFGAE